MSKYTFVDLFCGAGGLSTGLEESGFNGLLACDYNKSAIDTMNINHPNSINIAEPVQNLTKKRLKELIGDKKVNLVCGGPPCQGFSTIGLGNPDDERNSLFKNFIKVIKILNPDFVLFENVTGLLSKKNEKTLEAILKSFSKIGYYTHLNMMQAQQFGVAQNRRRTIIIAHKPKFNYKFPKAMYDLQVKGRFNKAITLGDEFKKIKKSMINNDKMHDLDSAKISKKLDLKRIQNIPEGGKIRYEKDELAYLPKRLRLDLDWKQIKEGRLRENHYHRLSRKLPSPTINTHNHHYFHPTEDRKLTLREFALLQSFPIDYQFSGSRNSIIRQIGNAVPPRFAKVLGDSIKKGLKSKKNDQNVQSKAQFQAQLLDLRSKAFRYV